MERKRTIILGSSEKLNNMSRRDVEALMRELGEKGLSPVLKEQNIPPELLPCGESLKTALGVVNFKEFEELLGQKGDSIPKRLWNTFWRFSGNNPSGHEVIKITDEPLYELDIQQVVSKLAKAETQSQKNSILIKAADEERIAKSYLDVTALVSSLQDGSFEKFPGIGSTTRDNAVELANMFIERAETTPKS